MIVVEQFYIGNRLFNKTYSNQMMQIYGGSPEGYYSECCEPADLDRTYVETNIPIEDEDVEQENKAEAYDILMGIRE